MKHPKTGQKVIVYDRYRFAIPLKGVIAELSSTNDGVAVRMLEQNNSTNPVGSLVWVSRRQLRRVKAPEVEDTKQQDPPKISQGEATTPPVEVPERGAFTNRTGDTCHVFTEDHSIADVIRYAASCSDLSEVRCLVDLMMEQQAQKQEDALAAARELLRWFLDSLPSNKDWLDPDLEKAARVLLKDPS